MEFVMSEQEGRALRDLKHVLHYRPLDPVPVFTSDMKSINASREHDSDGGGGMSVTNETSTISCPAIQAWYTVISERAIDAYILRFLRHRQLRVNEAIAALQQRRDFEQKLATRAISTPAMMLLRSGRLAVVGQDRGGRPVLCIYLSGSAQDASYAPSDVPISMQAQSQHPQQDKDATSEDDEVYSVAVMVLEYMQSICIDAAPAATSGLSFVASPISAPTNATDLSPPASPSRPLDDTPSNPHFSYRQEFVLLAKHSDETPTDGPDYHSLRSRAAQLTRLVSSCYPQLIAAVWLIANSASEQRRVRRLLAGAPAELQELVHLVTDSELSARMDMDHMLLSELGGANPRTLTQMNSDFADAVLRHWYTRTAYLQREAEQLRSNPAWPSRSLVRPPPYMLGEGYWVSSLPKASLAASAGLAGLRSVHGSEEHCSRTAPLDPDKHSRPAPPTPAAGELLQSISATYSPREGGNECTKQYLMPQHLLLSRSNGHSRPHYVDAARCDSHTAVAGAASDIDADDPPEERGESTEGPMSAPRGGARRVLSQLSFASALSSMRMDAGGSSVRTGHLAMSAVDDGLCSMLSMDEEAGEYEDEGILRVEQRGAAPNRRTHSPRASSPAAMGEAAAVLPESKSRRYLSLQRYTHITDKDAGSRARNGASDVPARQSDGEEGLQSSAECASDAVKVGWCRRKQPEQQLPRTQENSVAAAALCGVSRHPIVSPALRSIHDDINVLMSDIMARARETGTLTDAPSLVQLLDIAICSLEKAAGTRAESVMTTSSSRVMDAEDSNKSWCCCCA